MITWRVLERRTNCYGEDNCGRETHLIPRGKITRDSNKISVLNNKDTMDIVGAYTVTIQNKEYDTVCLMEYYDDGVLTEQFLDKNGRTILWRRFNKNDWAYKRYGELWSDMLPENETLIVNGETYVHWYDCVTDYIF